MRIGFIFPSNDYLFDPFRGDPHTHFQILTVLEEHFGDQVQLRLIDLRGVKREFAPYHIPECDVFLYSVYTLDYTEQVGLVACLRRRYPKAVHVAGGPHAVVFPDDALRTFDALVFGDGEESIIEVINDVRSGRLQKNYHQKTPIDINRYPAPRRHFLPEATIARKGLLTLKRTPGHDQFLGTTVIFSRGCPYQCAFCAMPRTKGLGSSLRYRAPDLIEKEIAYLKKCYGIQGVSLLDEIGVPLQREQAIAHIEALGRSNIPWRAQCRVDGVTPEIARLVKQAGCITMCMGVESAAQLPLDMIRKGTTVEQARESIRLFKEQGIECRVYMILGLPGEPPDIVERTWSFIQDTQPDLVYLSVLTVRPGTDMYKHPGTYGFKWVGSDWDRTMHMYSRYEPERPELTFAYQDCPQWGAAFTNEQIITNYLELQRRLKEAGMASLAKKPAASDYL